MDFEHLTDDMIQEYLDGNLGRDSEKIERHLETCILCSEKAESYRSVFAGLGKERGFELSADFADAVVSSVGLSGRTTFIQRHAAGVLMVIGAAVTLAALYYLTDLIQILLGAPIQGWLDSFFSAKAFVTIGDHAKSAASSIGIIASGFFALIMIWVLDRHIIRAKRRPSSLMI